MRDNERSGRVLAGVARYGLAAAIAFGLLTLAVDYKAGEPVSPAPPVYNARPATPALIDTAAPTLAPPPTPTIPAPVRARRPHPAIRPTLVPETAPAPETALAPTDPTPTTLAPTALTEGGLFLLTAASDVASVVLSNDAALSAEILNPRQVAVSGRQEGGGQVLLLDQQGALISRHAFAVSRDVTALETLIGSALPDASVRVGRSGEAVVLSGETPSSAQSDDAAAIASAALPSAHLVNLIHSQASDQLNISVRILEVRKSKLRALRVRWAALNPASEGIPSIGDAAGSAAFASTGLVFDRVALEGFVDFLRAQGAATLVAEPVLATTHGREARFQAGGETPVPTPSASDETVKNAGGYTFKPYGIGLEVTPRFLDDDHVRLSLSADVSEVDQSQRLRIRGATAPGMTTRKASTVATLRFGQSLAITGLSAHDTDTHRRRLPFWTPFHVGDILAGALRSKSADTELVMIVTPSPVVARQDVAAQAPRRAAQNAR